MSRAPLRLSLVAAVVALSSSAVFAQNTPSDPSNGNNSHVAAPPSTAPSATGTTAKPAMGGSMPGSMQDSRKNKQMKKNSGSMNNTQ